MKTKFLTLSALLLFTSAACFAQIDLQNVINSSQNILSQTLGKDEVVKGLKEALTIGSRNASDKVSKTDGFYKNKLIKIPFPKEARDMKSTLESMGMKKQVEAFEKQLNRAAEDAAKKAAPIFIRSVSSMTINDGMSILKGQNDAATQYLRKTTGADLRKEFKPVIANSLQKVQITKYWKPLMSAYNKVPFVKKVNPNLEEYVTDKAIEGLFKMIADEELKIRTDPKARVTDILKKVFGT